MDLHALCIALVFTYHLLACTLCTCYNLLQRALREELTVSAYFYWISP